jgi:hypothetical protein
MGSNCSGKPGRLPCYLCCTAVLPQAAKCASGWHAEGAVGRRVEAQCAKIVPGVWVARRLLMPVVVVYASHIDSLSVLLHRSIIAVNKWYSYNAKLPTDHPFRIILYDRSLQSMHPCFRVCRRADVRHVSKCLRIAKKFPCLGT